MKAILLPALLLDISVGPFHQHKKQVSQFQKVFLGTWHIPKEQPFSLPPLLFYQVKLEAEM